LFVMCYDLSKSAIVDVTL